MFVESIDFVPCGCVERGVCQVNEVCVWCGGKNQITAFVREVQKNHVVTRVLAGRTDVRLGKNFLKDLKVATKQTPGAAPEMLQGHKGFEGISKAIAALPKDCMKLGGK